MKYLVLALAALAAFAVASAQVSQEYLPPFESNGISGGGGGGFSDGGFGGGIEQPSQEYLGPVEQGSIGDDGYRYKTARRIRYRTHRYRARRH